MKGMNCNEKYILHIENSRAEPVIWENLGKYGGTDMLGTYKIRTDLAVEARERFTEDNVEVRGVEVQEDYNEEKDIRTTVVKITTENGARARGGPQGTYITIESEGLSAPDEDYHREVSEELSGHLRQLIGLEKEKSVLIVGLGNPGITADSLGPEVIGNLHMTRHLIREYGLKSTEKQILHAISGIVPGVMGQTGMETSEIVEGVVEITRPDVVIAVDALAARNTRRLNRTIQITDTGITPGSGVGNHRNGLTEENLNVKVIGIGVPTVVDAATIVHDSMAHLLETLDEAEQKEFLEEMISPHLHGMFNISTIIARFSMDTHSFRPIRSLVPASPLRTATPSLRSQFFTHIQHSFTNYFQLAFSEFSDPFSIFAINLSIYHSLWRVYTEKYRNSGQKCP